MLDFHSVYKDNRRFAVAMLKELTDSDILNAQHLDADLLQFFVDMKEYLDDTIVILMSDQGIPPAEVGSQIYHPDCNSSQNYSPTSRPLYHTLHFSRISISYCKTTARMKSA